MPSRKLKREIERQARRQAIDTLKLRHDTLRGKLHDLSIEHFAAVRYLDLPRIATIENESHLVAVAIQDLGKDLETLEREN